MAFFPARGSSPAPRSRRKRRLFNAGGGPGYMGCGPPRVARVPPWGSRRAACASCGLVLSFPSPLRPTAPPPPLGAPGSARPAEQGGCGPPRKRGSPRSSRPAAGLLIVAPPSRLPCGASRGLDCGAVGFSTAGLDFHGQLCYHTCARPAYRPLGGLPCGVRGAGWLPGRKAGQFFFESTLELICYYNAP